MRGTIIRNCVAFAALAACIAPASVQAASVAVLPPVLLNASVGVYASATGGGPFETVIFPPGNLPVALAESYSIPPGFSDPSPPFTTFFGSGSATLTVTGGSDPSIAMQASTTPDGYVQAGAGAYLHYSFEIVGPVSVGSIPAIFNGSSSVSGAGGSGEVTVTDTTTNTVVYDTGSIINTGSYSQNLMLTEGDVYTILMDGEVSVTGSGFNPVDPVAISKLLIDPTLTLGPGYSDYSIEYSPGLLTSGVPELSTWGMMLTGFAGLGVAGYRRSRKSNNAFTAA